MIELPPCFHFRMTMCWRLAAPLVLFMLSPVMGKEAATSTRRASARPKVVSDVPASGRSALHLDATEFGGGAQKHILIKISDSSHTAGPIEAHVYFIGRAPNNGARFIFAHSNLSVNLRGTPAATAKVSVPELKSDPSRRAPAGYALIGVGEMDGWIVVGETNGRTFQVLASKPALLDVAKGRSQDSLKGMVADYEKRMAEPRPRR